MQQCKECLNDASNIGEWYCKNCGSLRDECPKCDGEFLEDVHECSLCGTTPQAPCESCKRWIPANKKKCPECGFKHAPSGTKIGAVGMASIIGLGVFSLFLGVSVFPLWFSIFTFIPGGLLMILVGLVVGGGLTLLGSGLDNVNQDFVADISQAEFEKSNTSTSPSNTDPQQTDIKGTNSVGRSGNTGVYRNSAATTDDDGSSVTSTKETEVYTGPGESVGTSASSPDPPFCPACGTKLTAYTGVSYCPDCGESV